MGGVWERMIRTVRSILNALLNNHGARLDDESLGTFLYEVAGVINSRPLALDHVTDPDHPVPLTPNHLLMIKSKVILPPPGQFFRNGRVQRAEMARSTVPSRPVLDQVETRVSALDAVETEVAES